MRDVHSKSWLKNDLEILLEATNWPSTDIVPTTEAQLALPYYEEWHRELETQP
jgi:hypothetical protein